MVLVNYKNIKTNAHYLLIIIRIIAVVQLLIQTQYKNIKHVQLFLNVYKYSVQFKAYTLYNDWTWELFIFKIFVN